jgi:hypothetical protein
MYAEVWSENLQKILPIGKASRRWDNNIKMDLREKAWMA